jgi:hypothetical protein
MLPVVQEIVVPVGLLHTREKFQNSPPDGKNKLPVVQETVVPVGLLHTRENSSEIHHQMAKINSQ